MQLGWCSQADGGSFHYANKECPEFEVRKGVVETTMTVGAFVRECLMPFNKLARNTTLDMLLGSGSFRTLLKGK